MLGVRQALADGLRPRPSGLEQLDPGTFEFCAARAVEERFQHHLATVVPHRARSLQVTLGTHVWASVHVGAFLAHVPFLLPPLPRAGPPSLVASLPLSSCTSRCARLLDFFGHHRAACPRSGVLGSRGFSMENAAARICREVGARVSTNVFLRDLDFPIARHDARRLEVVADGLFLFGGAQLAVDTTLVSPVQANGHPRRRCAEEDGAALQQARQRKQLTYQSSLELSAGLAWSLPPRWEVGRMKPTLSFSSWQRRRRVSVPRILKSRTIQAWHHRWCSLLACASALSLLKRRPALGCDWDAPSTSDVVAACRQGLMRS